METPLIRTLLCPASNPSPPPPPCLYYLGLPWKIRPRLFGIVFILDVFRDKAVYKYVRSGKFATNIKDVFYVNKSQHKLLFWYNMILKSRFADVTVPENMSWPEYVYRNFDSYGDRTAIVSSQQLHNSAKTILMALLNSNQLIDKLQS